MMGRLFGTKRVGRVSRRHDYDEEEDRTEPTKASRIVDYFSDNLSGGPILKELSRGLFGPLGQGGLPILLDILSNKLRRKK